MNSSKYSKMHFGIWNKALKIRRWCNRFPSLPCYWISCIAQHLTASLSGWWIRKRDRLRIRIRVALNLCTEMFKLDPGAVIFEIENLIMIFQWLPVALRIKSKPSLLSAQCKKPFLFSLPWTYVVTRFSSAEPSLLVCTFWFPSLLRGRIAWGAHLAWGLTERPATPFPFPS